MQASESSLQYLAGQGAAIPTGLISRPNTRDSGPVASWIQSARAGNAIALGRLWEVCQQYLLAIGNQELGREMHAKVAASDLVQETFLKAHCGFHAFQGTTEGELLAWLRRILMNSLANHVRCFQNTEKRSISREFSLEADETHLSLLSNLTANVKSPSRHAIANEEARWLEQALGRLPEDQRQAVRLRTQLGFSFADVGELMNRSPEAARKLWSRAIERLQEERENCRGV